MSILLQAQETESQRLRYLLVAEPVGREGASEEVSFLSLKYSSSLRDVIEEIQAFCGRLEEMAFKILGFHVASYILSK